MPPFDQLASASCVQHVLYVVRRYVEGSPTLLRAAVRVLGEAVLDSVTEIAFFRSGALHIAMDMSKQVRGRFWCSVALLALRSPHAGMTDETDWLLQLR